LKSWESKIRAEFGKSKTKPNFKRIVLEKIDENKYLHTTILEEVSKQILKLTRNYDGKYSFYLRSILTRIFKFDPLQKQDPSPIELVLLVAEKDIKILPYSIVSSLSGCTNHINSLTIVFPEYIQPDIERILHRLSPSIEPPINLETDEEVLYKNGLNKFKFASSASKMQTIKLCLPFNSSKDLLIVDADTLLLRKRNWLSGEIQISPVSQEYLLAYNTFAKNILKKKIVSGLGFVTHHGLLRGKVITRMINDFGGIKEISHTVNTGIELNWNENFGSPSEWQLYGEYVTSTKTFCKSIPAGFSNLGISRSLIDLDDFPSYQDCYKHITKLREIIPELGSLSLHAYKDIR
jgi:hypothetical protein